MKLVIPTILAATVLIAGVFAFMPVEKAVTTHLPSVSSANIADGSVTSAKIADGTIVNADISGTAAIAGSKLADDSVTATQIAADAVTASELANNAVDTAAIADSQVTTAKIADDSVTSAKVAGSNSDSGPVRLVGQTDTGLLSLQTASHFPAVSSQGIAICTIMGTESGAAATTDGALTLTRAEGTGTIQGSAAIKIGTIHASENFRASAIWIITGATGGPFGEDYTCSASGTNLVAAEVDRIDVFIIWFPE